MSSGSAAAALTLLLVDFSHVATALGLLAKGSDCVVFPLCDLCKPPDAVGMGMSTQINVSSLAVLE
jgi:hypothetical protein